MTVEFIFILLVVYQLKHFLADYPFQGQYMLGKFSDDWKVWVPALSAHAGVHALMTWIIFQWVQGFYTQFGDVNTGLSAAAAAIDFVVHFTMDRIKASPNLMGRWKNLSPRDYEYYKKCDSYPGNDPHVHRVVSKIFRGNKYFWWALGFDQMVHHLTHYGLIYILIVYMVNHGK